MRHAQRDTKAMQASIASDWKANECQITESSCIVRIPATRHRTSAHSHSRLSCKRKSCCSIGTADCCGALLCPATTACSNTLLTTTCVGRSCFGYIRATPSLSFSLSATSVDLSITSRQRRTSKHGRHRREVDSLRVALRERQDPTQIKSAAAATECHIRRWQPASLATENEEHETAASSFCCAECKRDSNRWRSVKAPLRSRSSEQQRHCSLSVKCHIRRCTAGHSILPAADTELCKSDSSTGIPCIDASDE